MFAYSYLDRVKAMKSLSIVGAYGLNDITGTAIRDFSKNDDAGTASGIVLADDIFKDGRPAPLFDGSNDFIDIDTTAMGANIDFDLFTCMAWGKVSGASVWTDSTLRQLTKVRTSTGADHQFSLSKTSSDNSVRFQRQVGGQTLTHTVGSFSSTDWFCMVIVCTGTGGGNTVALLVR